MQDVGHLTHTHFFRLDLVLATVPIYIPPHSVFKLTLSYCFLNKYLLRNLLQFLIRHIFYMSNQRPAVTKCSTSLTGSENHLASFRFQNTFRLNV